MDTPSAISNPDHPEHLWYHDADDDTPMAAPANPRPTSQATGEFYDPVVFMLYTDVFPLLSGEQEG
jgi:hypothetical protein